MYYENFFSDTDFPCSHVPHQRVLTVFIDYVKPSKANKVHSLIYLFISNIQPTCILWRRPTFIVEAQKLNSGLDFTRKFRVLRLRSTFLNSLSKYYYYLRKHFEIIIIIVHLQTVQVYDNIEPIICSCSQSLQHLGPSPKPQ